MIYQRMANPCAHDVAMRATNSIRCLGAEGPSIYWITRGLYLTYTCVLNIYEVISQKYVTIRIESYKESLDSKSVIAVHSRCQGVVGCLAHVRAYSGNQ